MAEDGIPYNSQSTLAIYKMLVGDAQETNLTIAARVKHNQLNIALYLVFYQYHAFNLNGFSFNQSVVDNQVCIINAWNCDPKWAG